VADIVLSFHLSTWSNLSAPEIAILEANPVVLTELSTGEPLPKNLFYVLGGLRPFCLYFL